MLGYLFLYHVTADSVFWKQNQFDYVKSLPFVNMREELRVQAVNRILELNIQNDKELSDILELASSICETPYAFITLLNDKEQFLHANQGFTAETGIIKTSISRADSFCNHTIAQEDVFIVENTIEDERFNQNEIIKDSGIVFYAGHPLIDQDGHKLGALCVMDKKAKVLTGHQQTMLRVLSNQIIKIMEVRVSLEMIESREKRLEEQQRFIDDASIRLRSFFESSTNFQVLLGNKGEVIDFNKTAYLFIEAIHNKQLKRGDNIGQYLAPDFVETFHYRYNLALHGTNSVEEGSTDYDNRGLIWWDASFEPAKDEKGKIVGVSYIIRDITERKLKERKIIRQNEALLKIAHIQAHEFRAPLTTIMGLMDLIKQDCTIVNDEYFIHLDQAITNMDRKIRGIVNNIEESVVI